jgi:hypothetical protein
MSETIGHAAPPCNLIALVCRRETTLVFGAHRFVLATGTP